MFHNAKFTSSTFLYAQSRPYISRSLFTMQPKSSFMVSTSNLICFSHGPGLVCEFSNAQSTSCTFLYAQFSFLSWWDLPWGFSSLINSVYFSFFGNFGNACSSASRTRTTADSCHRSACSSRYLPTTFKACSGVMFERILK